MKSLDASPLIGIDPVICNDRFMAAINAVSTADSVAVLRYRLIQHLSIKTASYHHIPAVGAYNYEQLNRYFPYNVSPEVAKYFDSNAPKSDVVMRYVFAESRTMWLSEFLTIETSIGNQHVNMSTGYSQY